MKRVLIGVLMLLLAGCGVQPAEPIDGNKSTGVMLYLVQANSPIPVLRTSRNGHSVSDTLSLLADNPTGAERDLGLTTEVPAEAAPITVSGSTVTLQVDPNSLSALAVAQIACTAAAPGPDPAASPGRPRLPGRGDRPRPDGTGPVTLVGSGQSRGPVTCPV